MSAVRDSDRRFGTLPRRVSVLAALCVAVAAMLVVGAGGALAKPAATAFKCPKGFEKVRKTVTRHGHKRVVVHCRQRPQAMAGPVAPAPVVSAPAPAPAPVPAKLPSTTTLAAVYETLPPERLSTSTNEFKIGQYRLTGAVSPFAVPSLGCAGAAGCVEPAGSLATGTLTVPVLARSEYQHFKINWSVGVAPPAGKPSWIGLPELAAGSRFFQASGAPDPATYSPSSARAPIQLASPHLPGSPRHEYGFYDPTIEDEFQSIALVGTYAKVGGTGYDLFVESDEYPIANSDPGCVFQVRVSGVPPTPNLEWKEGHAESTFPNLTAGSKQIEIWVRHPGGKATCGLTEEDTFLITERPHS